MPELFHDLSPWWRFRISWARHRKAISESAALMIALFAAAAAVYSGWVAEKARREAFNTAMSSLAIQQQSMDADERPYVFIRKMKWETIVSDTKSPGTVSSWDDLKIPPGMFVHTYLTFAAVGRTPAVDVRVQAVCQLVDHAHSNDDVQIFNDEKSATLIHPFLFSEEQTDDVGVCNTLNKESLITGPDVAFVKLYGQVYYHEISHSEAVHHTPFCFENDGNLPFRKNTTGVLKYCRAKLPRVD
jgi:hypothetical protein